MKLLWVIKTPASQWKSANYNFKFSLFSAPFSCFLPLPTECCCYVFPPFLYPKWKRQLWKGRVLHGTQNHSCGTQIIKLKNAKLQPLQSEPTSTSEHRFLGNSRLSPWGHGAIFKMKSSSVGSCWKHSHPSHKNQHVHGWIQEGEPHLQYPRINNKQWSWNSKVTRVLHSSMNVGGSR